MSSVRILNTLALIVGMSLLGGASRVLAFDFGYTVGGDASCNFSTIQAAVTAAATSGETRINIAVNQTYTAQAIVINNQNLTLIGGYPSCSNLLAPSGNTTISGAGNGTHSVIAIGGTSNVEIDNLTITHGLLGSGQTGGGIYFGGSGTLTITSSTVTDNTAEFGAGIEVNGSDDGVGFTINGPDTFITGNTASDSGGGLQIEGHTFLSMITDGIFIGQNTATGGNGGGLRIVGPAAAEIGSPGTGTGVIYDNMAVNGGGVAVEPSQVTLEQAFLNLFTTDPNRPARISNNVATENGGGIYVSAYASIDPAASVDGIVTACAYRIDGNAAKEGSAVYLDSDSDDLHSISTGGQFYGMQNCELGPIDGAAKVTCTAEATCHSIDDNQAIDVNNDNQPTAGAAIFGQPGSIVMADRMMLRGNVGGYGIRQHGDSASVTLTNCLFAENQLSHELIFGDANAPVSITNCTFANDLIDAADVINNDTSISLSDSIIDEAGTQTLHFTGDSGNLHVANVLSNDITTLPSDPSIIQGDPMFVDMAHGDYRLTATNVAHSPAIDFAPAVSGDDRDIAGNPHDQDVPSIANLFGVRDLGAYEMQPIDDRIFADGFGDPISLVY